jgi:predicted DCC family thiol-disulfide oxidoreductase YuxK
MSVSATRGWVLYDGDCGVCSRWVPFWKETLQARGFAIAELQSEWVRERLGLSEGELVEDLRLLLADGRQVRDADVYRHVMRRVWWAFPIYVLSVMPLLRAVFNLGYRLFADNRYAISHSCGVAARRPRGSAGASR